MEEYKRCPYCDELIRTNALKCKHCGSTLTDAGYIQGEINTPGTQVRAALSGKYEILEEIGRGGMASVYKAIQKNLNRHVALKVIHQNFVYDKEFLERFHQEAQLCGSLNHPNIVTIYDEGAINNIHYMAMEYLAGNDLQRIIRYTNKIKIEDTIKIVASIANALDHAHGRGLIHRDIKCSNIIITNEGRTILTDFGIAYAATSRKLTQTGSLIGTPEYMSPEQAKGVLTDSRTDIYSLGVVLFECLTGKVPFGGNTPLATMYKILNEKAPSARELNKDVPVWLSSVVARALEKDPGKRFQTGKEFALALARKNPVTEPRIKKDSKHKLISETAAAKPRNTKNWILYFLIILFPLLGLASYFIFNLSGTINPPPLNNNGIVAAVKKADALYQSGNLTYPPDNCAYSLYVEVLTKEPANNQALNGLENIKNSFLDRANSELQKARIEKSKLLYENTIAIADSGLNYFKDSPEFDQIISLAENEINTVNKPSADIESPKVTRVKVPGVIGSTPTVAENLLSSVGLNVKVSSIKSPQVNIVLNQVPAGGAYVKEGATVIIIVGVNE